MMTFQKPDNETLESLRRSVREFCDEKIRPGARKRDRTGEFPEDLVGPLADMGFFGVAVPEEYGGSELDPWSYAILMEELGAADSSARSLISVSQGLVAGSIARWGNEKQKQQWLPRIVAGELGAFGLTEAGAGSNPGELRTRAVWDGDAWVVNGSKMFITNGSRGVVTLVFARAIVDGEDGGVSCFLVPQDSEGYKATSIHGKLGIRASDTAEIALTDLRVDADSLLGVPGDGFKIALSALDNGRFALAAASTGLAREALELSLAYSKEREQFGSPLASKQLIQEMLADMHVEIEAARGLVERVAGKKAAGLRFTLEASAAKLFATEAASRCADRAVQIHGGYGYLDEYPVQRLLRDARVTTLYEGTSQVQRLLIGRALTGVSAY